MRTIAQDAAQAMCDVPQGLRSGELTKNHAYQMIPAADSFAVLIGVVLTPQLFERIPE